MSGLTELLADFRWAMNMMRVKRIRRGLLFSERVRFDDALRPRVEKRHPQHEPAVIAYPDALYHAKAGDVIRALRASQPVYTRSPAPSGSEQR